MMSEKANDTSTARTTAERAVSGVNSAPINLRKSLTGRQRAVRIAAVAGVVLLLPYRLRVTGESAVVSSVGTEATAPADGIVRDVRVKEGDPVKAGDSIGVVVGKDGSTLGPITSPIGGVIATPTHALAAKAGSWVHAGDSVATVLDRGKLIVRVSVPQREVSDTRVGQVAAVKLQGYPGQTLAGRVTGISESTHVVRGEVVVPVEVTLDEAPEWLRPGMRGWTKLGGDVTVIGVLIVRRLARSIWIELWSLF